MAKAICRCGHPLPTPDETGRVVCAHCGARVRIRMRPPEPGDADGFIRFLCACGRRLKVPAANRPTHGQCPDCGRVVPIPEPGAGAGLPPGHPETPTADLDPTDRAALERWIRRHTEAGAAPAPGSGAGSGPVPAPAPAPVSSAPPTAASARVEAGLRVCPRCGRPVHLQAETCRHCGAAVPRR